MRAENREREREEGMPSTTSSSLLFLSPRPAAAAAAEEINATVCGYTESQGMLYIRLRTDGFVSGACFLCVVCLNGRNSRIF